MAVEVLRIRVLGRVQGVGFRYSACRQARVLGLCGWVRNEHDGSVTVHMQGSTDAVDAMRRWLAKGPPHAGVERCVEIPAPCDYNLKDFEIIYF